MITVKVNIVALIVSGIMGARFYVALKEAYSSKEIIIIAVLTLIVIRAYDAIASLLAFKDKKSGGKNENKTK